MRIYLSDSRSMVTALARGLATGHTVWCQETGEGWQMGRPLSLRHARILAKIRVAHEDEKTFFYDNEEVIDEA